MGIEIEPLLLHYFYNDVILYFEKVIKCNPTGLRITNPIIRAYLTANNTFPVFISDKSKLSDPQSDGNHNKSFIICRKISKYSMLVCLFAHFRNCLAHGHFSFFNVDGRIWVTFKDFAPRGGELSMVAQMPFDVFFGLIYCIKQIKE